MGFPTKYEDLTVGQWMAFKSIQADDDLSVIDMQKQLVSLFTGLELTDVENMDIIKFGNYVKKLSFLNVELKEMPIVENWKGFKATLSLTEMKANQMIDYESILKAHGNNIYRCTDKLLAIVYKEKDKPYNPDKHEEHTKLFSDAKLTDVIGVVFFYSVYSFNAGKIIQICTDKANRIVTQRMKEIQESKQLVPS